MLYVTQIISRLTDDEVQCRPEVHPDHHDMCRGMMFITDFVLGSTRDTVKHQRQHLERHTGWSKNLAHLFVRLTTSSNVDEFSNFFHCQNQEKIGNNTTTKDPITPQVCRYTTLWNVSVLKATIESKMTSVTTHFNSASSSSKADTVNIWYKNCRMWQLLYM